MKLPSGPSHRWKKNRPMFPFFQLCMLWIRLVSGANVVTDGPIRRIHALRRPILMIQSRQDIYSLPEKESHKRIIQSVELRGVDFFCSRRFVRKMPAEEDCFEKVWSDYRERKCL